MKSSINCVDTMYSALRAELKLLLLTAKLLPPTFVKKCRPKPSATPVLAVDVCGALTVHKPITLPSATANGNPNLRPQFLLKNLQVERAAVPVAQGTRKFTTKNILIRIINPRHLPRVFGYFCSLNCMLWYVYEIRPNCINPTTPTTSITLGLVVV